MFIDKAFNIFNQSIKDYHKIDKVEQPIKNPYEKGSIEYLFYLKNWIDTIQWHYEDIIRDTNINPIEALILKRKIDESNQQRTDIVEYIDNFFLKKYKNVITHKNATINTESPAWAIDRLSILAIKIYHMSEEANRKNANEEHRQKCQKKLEVLLEQKKDLSNAIETLLTDIEQGSKYMKTYKQMKMYNDESLNPILYKNK